MIGKTVKVIVDRPLGSCHPEHRDIYYSVNYGYVKGIIAPDGEEQDAYILGVDTPINEFTGKVIAIIHREDDVEDKWVVAPESTFSVDEIERQVNFQEKFFKHTIVTMKKVKITVMRMARYDDLIAQYENPIEHACDMQVGQTFIANGYERPIGFCDSAWDSVAPFVKVLAEGGGNFYDGWMKNEKSAMISCNDGFRPVSFLLETLEDQQ